MRKKIDIFIEMIAFIALIMLINFMVMRSDMGFHKVNPNPLWIVIIMVAARYGTGWGALSALMVSSIYLLTLPWNSAGLTSQLYARTPGVILFFIIAFILGETCNSLKKYVKAAEEESARKKNEVKGLTEKYTALEHVKKELETKVLGHHLTISSLYETARRLSQLQLEEVYPAVLETVKEYIEADKCSLYMLDNDRLGLKSYLGYETPETPPKTIAVEGNTLWRNIQNAEVFTMREQLQASGEPQKNVTKNQLPSIVCCPVKFGTGNVIGMVNIEQLSFVKFHDASINLFSIISEWASRSIETAMRYKDAEKMRINDPLFDINSYKYFQKRMEEELQNAKRYTTVFSLLLVRIEGISLLSKDHYEEILGSLVRAFSGIFRKVDLICHFSDEETLAVILPFTPAEGTLIVKERVKKELLQFYTLWHEVLTKEASDTRILLGVNTYRQDQEDADAFINIALEVMEDIHREKGADKTK